MKFLLFNLAVVGALFYLFTADRSVPEVSHAQRDDPLLTIIQNLESMARDFADNYESAVQDAPRSAAAEILEPAAQTPPADSTDPAAGEPKDPSTAAAPAPAEPAAAEQDVARAEQDAARAEQDAAPTVAPTPQALDDDPQEINGAADPIGPLPPVADPAVARRRAEVLDGIAPLDDRASRPPAKVGPPMSAEERLRKLYSLAEEMELFYVSKMTR